MVVDDKEQQLLRAAMATTTSANPIIPGKQNLKLIGGGTSFLRNGFAAVKANSAKRKSAVELLQESKAYYVKSEKVLDAKQEFKHSEHLQVSANPNFDLLLKPSGSSKPGDLPTHPYGHTLPPSTRRSIPEFKLKAIERKLHELNTEHRREHHHHNHNHHHHNHHHPHHGTTPALPPKSPRNLRLRSKTQPESTQVSGTSGGKHHTEYRRSQSMPDKESLPRDDIQMKLRRLLQTDSKENLSGSIGSLHRLNVTNGESRGKNGLLGKESCVAADKEKLETPNVSPKSDVAGDAAILQPRQQQEGNYSIHKSMPDLSPTKLGLSKQNGTGGRSVKSRGVPHISRTARSSPTPSNGSCESESDGDDGESVDGSLSVAPPKSVELRRAESRATSDYVSRSPSCKCEYLTSTILGKDIQENGNDLEEEKASDKPTELPFSNTSNKVADRVMEMNNNNNKSSQNSPKTNVLHLSERRSGAPRVPPPPPPKRRSMAPPVTNGMRDADGNGNHDGSPRRRPILRSKSDISHRFSKSSDFVDKTSPTNRSYQGNEDLERFFCVMGLDAAVLQHLSSPPSDMSSPVFFASTSSVDSINRTRTSHHSGDSDGSPAAARSGPAPTTVTTPSGAPPPSQMTSVTTPRENTGNGIPGLTNKDLAQHGHTETSIVERNARVIKWLYNCRKAKVDGNGTKS